MYIYFDESFISIKGVRYLFLGCIAYTNECTENILHKEFTNSKHKFKNKQEIKFTNVRNSRIRDRILHKIKSKAIFTYSCYSKLEDNTNLHQKIKGLIDECLLTFSKNTKIHNLKIIYDKSTYKLNENELKKKFTFVQNLKMRDSSIFAGLQHADWIVGEAALLFKTKNSS